MNYMIKLIIDSLEGYVWIVAVFLLLVLAFFIYAFYLGLKDLEDLED